MTAAAGWIVGILLAVINFKPSGSDLDSLQKAAACLMAANAALSKAKKESDSAKATIGAWLEKERDLKIETLPIGEFVIIENVCFIEIGKQNKFDEKAFLASNAELHAQFKKDFSVVRFKPATAA